MSVGVGSDVPRWFFLGRCSMLDPSIGSHGRGRTRSKKGSVGTEAAKGDKPARTRAEDALGTWKVAQRVARFATSTPHGWSVRIGIHGPWGTGKTTVLNFVEELVKPEHVVVKFSPWGYEDQESLWRAFVGKVYSAAESAGIEVGGAWERLKRVRGTVGELANVAAGFAGVDIGGVDILNKMLSFGPGDLASLHEGLGSRRLVVLIDDLDRSNPAVLPNVFFSLSELLALPAFSFILAFDPVVVSRALESHHPGWAEASAFMEKIIDVVFPIPAPTERQVLRLARERLSSVPYISDDVVLAAVPLLPRNPRSLTRFAQHMWALAADVERHDADELSVDALLRSQLLRIEFPALAHLLFGDREKLRDLWDPHEHSDSRRRIEILLGEAKVAPLDVERARALVESVVFTDLLLVPENTIYAAYLAERSPSITRRELKERLGSVLEGRSWELPRWLNEVSETHGRDEESVVEDIFRAATDYRQILLGQAADCRTDDELKRYVEEAGNLRQLIRALAFDAEGFVGDVPALRPEHFGYLLRKLEEFSHFQNRPVYARERAAELDLAEEICRRTSLPISELLAQLRLWDTPLGVNEDEVTGIREHLKLALSERLREYLLLGLSVPGRYRGILASSAASQATRSVLLSADGPLSDGPFREDLRRALSPIASDEAVYGNAWEFLDLLRTETRAPTNRGAVNSLWFKDAARILLQAVGQRPVQPRMVGSLRLFEEALGISDSSPSEQT